MQALAQEARPVGPDELTSRPSDRDGSRTIRVRRGAEDGGGCANHKFADVAHEIEILPARNWTRRFFSARAFLYQSARPRVSGSRNRVLRDVKAGRLAIQLMRGRVANRAS